MNDEHGWKNGRRSLDERFDDDPKLRERFHQIADLRDQLLAQGVSLDEVEGRTVQELRLLGQEFLHSIAQEKSRQSTAQALRKNPAAIAHRKKK